jgi:hypothetical protein
LAIGDHATCLTGVARIGKSNQYASFYIGCNALSFDSDQRIKQDIQRVNANQATMFIKQLEPKFYRMIKSPENGIKAGFVAQDVAKAQASIMHPDFKMATHDPDSDTWHLEYQALHALTVAAMQDLIGQNEKLRAANVKLHQRLDKLEMAFAKLNGGFDVGWKVV